METIPMTQTMPAMPARPAMPAAQLATSPGMLTTRSTDPPPTGSTPSGRSQARLRRAMTMAALAAVLALGGVFGLHPRVAEATPRALPKAEAGRRPALAPVPTAGRPGERASPDPPDEPNPAERGTDLAGAARGGKRASGRLNLNTATAAELMLLPGIGPAKAERVLTWRKRNGTFRRVADLRRVKGFGYRTVKRLEPYLDIKGETTLRATS